MNELIIVGGGLAGCEAAYQALKRGVSVKLYEMRPLTSTSAHITGNLAELVCSNSLGSLLPDRASGLLMHELEKLDSLLLRISRATAVPSGSSLSVDRNTFSHKVEQELGKFPNFHLIRYEIKTLPDSPTILASGPLTSPSLAEAVAKFTGQNNLFFYDAVAPIIFRDSIDFSIAFSASRFAAEKGQTADYINCPMSRDEFDAFVSALVTADRIPLKIDEKNIVDGVNAGKSKFFEGCLPIEIMAERGQKALTFGPMRPIGLMDPRTNQRPYAVAQLRQDDLSGSLYNMVGFQTNLTYPEQKRVLRMIPGLKHAEFMRLGQMHRNTFIGSPTVLFPTMQSKIRPDVFFAGQITGIEGYLGNISSGLLAGINAVNFLRNSDLLVFPPTTMIGALCRYITESSPDHFQPIKANFGLLPEIKNRYVGRLERTTQYVENASLAMDTYLQEVGDQLR